MALSDMTFSTVDVDFVKSYLRIDEEFADDDIEIQLFLDVARSWVLEHTGMTEEQLDKIHFSTILLLKYTADFYNDRTGKSTNKMVVDPIMDMLLTKIRNYNLGSIQEDEIKEEENEEIEGDV